MKFFVVNANVIRYFSSPEPSLQVAGLSITYQSFQRRKANLSLRAQIAEDCILLCSEEKPLQLIYSITKMHHRVIPFHIKWLVGFLRAKLCCSFRNKTSFMIFLFSIPLFIKVSDHMVNVNCALIDLERALGLSSWKKASSVTLWFWVNSNVRCRSK